MHIQLREALCSFFTVALVGLLASLGLQITKRIYLKQHQDALVGPSTPWCGESPGNNIVPWLSFSDSMLT